MIYLFARVHAARHIAAEPVQFVFATVRAPG